EFGPNFCYMVCRWGKPILLSARNNPLPWSQLSTTYAPAVWCLFIYHLRPIHPRTIDPLTKSIRLFTGEPEPTNCSIFMCWFLYYFSSTSPARWPFGSGLISSLLAVVTSG